jgi:hypothetical protein
MIICNCYWVSIGVDFQSIINGFSFILLTFNIHGNVIGVIMDMANCTMCHIVIGQNSIWKIYGDQLSCYTCYWMAYGFTMCQMFVL